MQFLQQLMYYKHDKNIQDNPIHFDHLNNTLKNPSTYLNPFVAKLFKENLNYNI